MMNEDEWEFDRRRFRGRKLPNIVILCIMCEMQPASLDDMVCDDCALRIKDALTMAGEEPPVSATIIDMEEWRETHGRDLP